MTSSNQSKMKTDNFLQRTLDEVERDHCLAQNPRHDFGDIFRQIQENAEFWEYHQEAAQREARGLEAFDDQFQYAPRGQYQGDE